MPFKVGRSCERYTRRFAWEVEDTRRMMGEGAPTPKSYIHLDTPENKESKRRDFHSFSSNACCV